MKRTALLREAGRAFKRDGFHKASLDDIAQALNVTKGALYHYVRNKHEILFECHKLAMDLGEEALENAESQGSNGADKIRMLVGRLVENLTGDLGEIAVLTEVEALRPRDRKAIQERRDAFDRAFRGILEEGIAGGSIRECNVRMAEFWVMGALNWIPKWFSPEGQLSSHDLAETFADFAINGLAARPERRGGSRRRVQSRS
jgi:AcrR family transcriptional regulator